MKTNTPSQFNGSSYAPDGIPPVSAASLISLLPFRLVFFAVFQVLIAVLLSLTSVKNAWQASSAWWLITGTLANILTIILISALLKKEGTSYFQEIHFNHQTVKKDLLVFLVIFLLSGPIAMLPSMLSGQWIIGSTEVANSLLIQAMPLWAAWVAIIIFPITVAYAELPFYFGYLMPRIENHFKSKWFAILLPVLFLSAQHSTLPLIFNWQFIIWRLIAFLPFALMLGILIHWRPRMLPYLMIMHGLIDTATALMVLLVSMGMPIA